MKKKSMGSYAAAGARSADSLELGGYSGYLPAPGAPEPLNGCGCHGQSAMGDTATWKPALTVAGAAALIVGGQHKGWKKWAFYAAAAGAFYESLNYTKS